MPYGYDNNGRRYVTLLDRIRHCRQSAGRPRPVTNHAPRAIHNFTHISYVEVYAQSRAVLTIYLNNTKIPLSPLSNDISTVI
ncbi:hypothetical protein NECAME_09096 [Necator americanus]|uniref:Uncharacterized protein n=1 Tax=Necator americanus TaxID=51031 RepID=W2TFC5_NECAM|nr:hypothetical protein NECAME_09096 [Necator americanus]ETN80548.1 hypothetical protein NECAME_09096 [Necator americanus]